MTTKELASEKHKLEILLEAQNTYLEKLTNRTNALSKTNDKLLFVNCILTICLVLLTLVFLTS